MGKFTGKTALITGGAKRLGSVMTRTLAKEGATVIIHCFRSAEAAETLRDAIAAEGGKAEVLSADLSDAAQLAQLTENTFGKRKIEILINNASLYIEDTLSDADRGLFLENIGINAWAPLSLSRAMDATQNEGAIVNLLDARIVDQDPVHFSYHAAKRILTDFTAQSAAAFAPKIRVNAIAPGLVLAPENSPAEYMDSMKQHNLLNREGAPDDISRAMIFLLESRFITGQVLFVDGGRHLRSQLYL